MKNKGYYYILIILTVLIFGCTEEYDLNSEGSFEEIPVIEATITNVLKKQKIRISNSISLDSTKFVPTTTAEVSIEDSQGNNINFTYNPTDTTYTSNISFQALPDRNYTLKVKIGSQEYTSEGQLTRNTILDSIHLERKINNAGEEGIEISVNSYDPTGNSIYYRYKTDQCYKTIAPYWSPYKAVYIEPQYPWQDPVLTRIYDPDAYTEVCYKTSTSKKVILNSTSNLSEDRIINFPIKFLPKNDYSIKYRYGIKITQYVVSYEAYNYFQQLNNISENTDILSPTQPGYIEGNIKQVGNPTEKVIGFFEVVSESSRKVFFKHQDFFPNEPIPSFFRNCDPVTLDKLDPPPPNGNGEGLKLLSMLQSNTHILYDAEPGPDYRYFTMVPPECGDCAAYANPEPPDFWEEE